MASKSLPSSSQTSPPADPYVFGTDTPQREFHVFSNNTVKWQRRYFDAITAGLLAQGQLVSDAHTLGGIPVFLGPNYWSVMQRECARRGINYLIVNRAFWGDPDSVAISWNGFNGWGDFCEVEDNGERWRRTGPLARVQPLRLSGGKHVAVFGQFSAHSERCTLWQWYKHVAHAYKGHALRFRPHPSLQHEAPPHGMSLHSGTLDNFLQDAYAAVTFNSTVVVECLLSGVPTYAHDVGNVAWAGNEEQDVVGRRDALFAKLAWAQWHISEIMRGTFLPHLFARAPRNAPHAGFKV